MVASPPHSNGTHGSGSTRSAPEPDPSGAQRARSEQATADPLAPLLNHLAELREYAGYFLSTQIDRWRVSARNAVMYGIVGVLGAVVAGTGLIVAVVLLLNGLAAGIGALFDGRVWIGQVMVGASILGAVGLGAWIWLNKQLDAFEQTLKEKYERRKISERALFGTDVEERAASGQRP